MPYDECKHKFKHMEGVVMCMKCGEVSQDKEACKHCGWETWKFMVCKNCGCPPKVG